MTIRVVGHGLIGEGAPYDESGNGLVRGMAGFRRGAARAKCECGELSEVLPSNEARRSWHRNEHKQSATKRPVRKIARPNYSRITGHGLVGKGAAHDVAGRLAAGGGGREGHALCGCGELSPRLSSGKLRGAWHLNHRRSVAETRDALLLSQGPVISLPLPGGLVTLIDRDDYELVRAFRWFATNSGPELHYARCHSAGYMHRLLIGAPDGICVDHANHDGLDNRRSNLRLAGQSNNSANTRRRAGRSGFRGVHREDSRWVAAIRVNYKTHRLGRFKQPEVAARAYDRAARRFFGSFATLNFPEELQNV